MRTIIGKEVETWTLERRNAFLSWLVLEDINLHNCIEIVLNDDGTYDITFMVRDARGVPVLDPKEQDRILTVIEYGHTPSTACSEHA